MDEQTGSTGRSADDESGEPAAVAAAPLPPECWAMALGWSAWALTALVASLADGHDVIGSIVGGLIAAAVATVIVARVLHGSYPWTSVAVLAYCVVGAQGVGLLLDDSADRSWPLLVLTVVGVVVATHGVFSLYLLNARGWLAQSRDDPVRLAGSRRLLAVIAAATFVAAMTAPTVG